MRRILCLLSLALLLQSPARADLDTKMTFRANGQPLAVILQGICAGAGLSLVLGPEIGSKKATVNVTKVRAADLLSYLSKLHNFGIAFAGPGGRTVLIGTKERIESFDTADLRVVQLANTDAEKMAGLLNKAYDGKVTVLSDPRSNSLILVPKFQP